VSGSPPIAEPEGVFGHPHRHLRVTESTNEVARALAASGAPSGTVVTASAQTAGRGRHGRVWSAPAGKALLFSAVLAPVRAEHALLPLAVPVAACEAIEGLAPLECRIKWPNDIWIEERKVAGILIEARPPKWAVIGIGVNVAIDPEEFPADVRWPATSVGHGVSVEATRVALCERLDRWTAATPASAVRAFRDRDALAGRAVEWEGGAGRAVGIGEDGNLVVELEGGETVSLGSGEVSLRIA
jgi:BirA family transcriptional regulator, biotin operon repressor / biotin---[acetyl-CoA-carboxylase] ligase